MSRVGLAVPTERLKRLKEVLDISEHQTAQWKQFAGAVHAAIKIVPWSPPARHVPSRANYPSLPQAIESHFHQNLLRLEACRALQSRVAALYSVLSDKQRLLADRLLAPLLVSVLGHEQGPPIGAAA